MTEQSTQPNVPWSDVKELAHKLHRKFIGSRVFDTLCGRSGICDPGSHVQFFKSGKMLESLWKVCALPPRIIEVKPVACLWDVFFCQFSENSHRSSEIICCNAALSAVAAAPDGWQRCLEMIRLPRAWDDVSDSACFWKCMGQAKNQILWFSLLESRHFKEGFLIWVGA